MSKNEEVKEVEERCKKCEHPECKCPLDDFIVGVNGIKYHSMCQKCPVLPDFIMQQLGRLRERAEDPELSTDELIRLTEEMRKLIETIDTKIYTPWYVEAQRAISAKYMFEPFKEPVHAKKSWKLFG